MSAPEFRTGLITLTTDFGRDSSYVGSLKGALYSAARAVTLVDLSHDIPAYDTRAGALLLRAAAPAFPSGTVHLAVIDPGVGGPRRPLIVIREGALFVGPDNGLFTPFLTPGHRAWVIHPAAAPGAVCPTFHGRDLFAPVAARLATGADPSEFASPIADPVRLDWPEPRRAGGALLGAVLQVDGYGNVLTSIPQEMLPAVRGALRVEIAGVTIVGVVRTYAERSPGTLMALVGSSGLLEVAVARGHAAARLGVNPGDPVRVVVGGAT